MHRNNITKAADHFSLNKLAAIVDHYPAPSGVFDPESAWVHRYDIYSLAWDPMQTKGDLSIERSVCSDKGFVMKTRCRLDGYSGFSHFLQAEFQCRDHALSMPIYWSVRSKLAESAEAAPYRMSGVEKSVQVKQGCLVVKTGKARRNIRLGGDHTGSWCLFDAVQRLSVSTRPLSFTWIDAGDAVAGQQTLRFHRHAVVQMRNRDIAVHAFICEGEGVIPTVYWVDASGRLLFVVSGLEIYVLAAENGCEIPYQTEGDAS